MTPSPPRMVQIFIDKLAKKSKIAYTYNREKGGIESPQVGLHYNNVI